MNLFEELEIDTSVKDPKKILELVDQKIKEWSKKTNPKYKAQAPAKLKALRALKTEIMAKPEAVIADHAARYADIIHKKKTELEEKLKEEAVFYIVNGAIDQVSLDKLAAKYDLKQNDVLKILDVKLKKIYQEDNIVPLEQYIVNPISAELEIVGKKDLYDFLGLPRTALEKEISAYETNIRKKNEGNSNKLDPQIGANIKLCGMCSNYLLKEESRKRYDKTLDTIILDDVKEKVDIMTNVDKHIRGDKYAMLLKRCLDGGISQEKAEYYIKKYAADNGATITEEQPQPQQPQPQPQQPQPQPQSTEPVFEDCFNEWITLTDAIYVSKDDLTSQEFALFENLYGYWRLNNNFNPSGCEPIAEKLFMVVSNRSEDDNIHQGLIFFINLCGYFYATSAPIYKRFRDLSLSNERNSGEKAKKEGSESSNSGTGGSGSGSSSGNAANKNEKWQDNATLIIGCIWIVYVLYSFWTEGFWDGVWETIKSGILGFIILCSIFSFKKLSYWLAFFGVVAAIIAVFTLRGCSDKDSEKVDEKAPVTVVVSTTTYHSISESGLNIRAAANGSARVIGTLLYNQEVEVLKIENGYAKIKYGSGIGYVSENYIEKGQSKKNVTKPVSSTNKTAPQPSQQTKTQSTNNKSTTATSAPVSTTKAQSKPTTATKPQTAPQPAKAKTAVDYYNEGMNLAKNFKEAEAKASLQKAIDMGSVDATYYLGMMCINGGESTTGFPLVLKAANAGHKEATFQVAELYNAGTGTDKDKTQAKEWYQKAEALGDSRATSRLRKL